VGAAYQIGTIIGTYDDSDNLNPLFSDLPQLCLLTCVVITGVMWQIIAWKEQNWNSKQSLTAKFAPFLFLISLYLVCRL
jgi:hypothetical protein